MHGKARDHTISNIVLILQELVESDKKLGMNELAERLGFSASVTHRLLRALAEENILSFEAESKLYGIGAEFLRLAAVATNSSQILSVARRVMQELVRIADEAVCLNLFDEKKGMFTVLAVEQSSQALQYVVDVGKLHPLNAGASGKSILAFLPDTKVERILQRHSPTRVTGSTVTDLKALMSQLGDIRDRGFAVSFGERLEGAVGIACPVFDAAGQVCGSLQFTIPEHRFEPDDVNRLSELLRNHARRLQGFVRLEVFMRPNQAVVGA